MKARATGRHLLLSRNEEHTASNSYHEIINVKPFYQSGFAIHQMQRDEYGRYEWDEEEFEKRFQERKKRERTEQKTHDKSQQSDELRPLVAREDFVELSRGINKRKVIGDDVPLSKIGNYSCPACQLYFKDSSVYLKHLNSPEHNEKIGMSMKVMPVTDDEVLERVQQWEDFYTMNKPVPPLYREG